MAKDTVFFEEVSGNETNSYLEDIVAIDKNGLGALGAVTPSNLRGDRFAIGDDGVDDAATDVSGDGTKMIAERVLSGFAGLRHEIGDVHAGSFGASDGASNLWDEKVGDHAGVQRAGPEEDEVGLPNGFDGCGEGTNATRIHLNFANGSSAAGNSSFALNALAVGEGGRQVHMGKCGGEDAATHGENLTGNADGFGKVAGDMSESGKKKIAEIVAAKPAPRMKTILEKPAEKWFVLGEGDHAVANVAGREHAIFAAKAARTTAVIRDRNDSGKVGDGTLERGMTITLASDVFP